MATVPKPRHTLPSPPRLHSGDRMTRAEFHRIYEQMPEKFKAELVGGVVYVASPLGLPHGMQHSELDGLLAFYKTYTPGTEVGNNVTVLLSDEGEPQPDLYLRILPECGGQTKDSKSKYIVGAPELVAEVAHSSKALDLNAKLADYAEHGVKEYLVACVEEDALRWFDLAGGKERHADKDGMMRIPTFPGLWIDVAALLARDGVRYYAALQQGLASKEHGEFVKRLAAARTRNKKKRR